LFLKTDGAGNLSFSSDLPTTSFTGATVETSIADSDLVLIYDDSATAVRKMTKANLVAGLGGKVLQVIQATDSTVRTTTSTSFVTGSNTLSVSITPSSASNKIYIMVHSTIKTDTIGVSFESTIFRDATNLAPSSGSFSGQYSNTAFMNMPMAFNYLDSPSSTSSLTYQVYFRVTGVGTGYLNADWGSGTLTATITAFEIAG
jgi:hypothetical protein